MSFYCNTHKVAHDACDDCLKEALDDITTLLAAIEQARGVWPAAVPMPDIDAIKTRATTARGLLLFP